MVFNINTIFFNIKKYSIIMLVIIMKRKILIASYNLDFGGIETSLINFLKNIDLNKFEVTLVLEEKNGVFLKDVPENIIIKEYKISKNKNILIRKISNMLKKIKWIINNYKKYDSSICYATYSMPCSFIARASSNNKILFVHSNYYQAYDKDIYKTKRFFDGIKISDYNHVVFVSNESRKEMNKIYSNIKDRFITINNIVDFNKIKELANKDIDIKETKNKKFLFVGRLDESSKRLSILLETAKKCKNEKVNASFWIVGSGPDERLYKEFIKNNKLDNVVLFGAKKNPYPYIKKCDYLIITSKYEGFPVVYNESIVLGKPILTTVDVSDDFISIPDRFGYVVKDSDVFKKIKKISIEKNFIVEKVDYDKLNKKRIKMIEDIMESK